ncbi:MAG: hypothetical protein KDD53_11735 [Bdellovibrionales bacterium]|nr:hypothetical protein [Bdellovibrionales bacterium]
MLKNLLSKSKVKPLGGATLNYPVLFGPSVFFIALGVAALFAPNVLLGIIAGFFLFLGLASCFLAWKFIKLKGRIEKAVKDLQGRVSIHSVNISSDPFDEFDDFDELELKKTILH